MSDRKRDPRNVVDRLSGRFGTQARLAEAAGCSQPTISERRKLNSFSHQQMRNILARAPEMDVHVEPADFFPDVREDDAERRAGEAAA